MEDFKKKYPSLPRNYVTIVDLQKRWAQQQQQQQQHQHQQQQSEKEKNQKLKREKTEELNHNLRNNYNDSNNVKRSSQIQNFPRSKPNGNPNFVTWRPRQGNWNDEKPLKVFRVVEKVSDSRVEALGISVDATRENSQCRGFNQLKCDGNPKFVHGRMFVDGRKPLKKVLEEEKMRSPIVKTSGNGGAAAEVEIKGLKVGDEKKLRKKSKWKKKKNRVEERESRNRVTSCEANLNYQAAQTAEKKGLVTLDDQAAETAEGEGLVTLDDKAAETAEEKGLDDQAADTAEEKGLVTLDDKAAETAEEKGLVTLADKSAEVKGLENLDDQAAEVVEEKGQVILDDHAAEAAEEKGQVTLDDQAAEATQDEGQVTLDDQAAEAAEENGQVTLDNQRAEMAEIEVKLKEVILSGREGMEGRSGAAIEGSKRVHFGYGRVQHMEWGKKKWAVKTEKNLVRDVVCEEEIDNQGEGGGNVGGQISGGWKSTITVDRGGRRKNQWPRWGKRRGGYNGGEHREMVKKSTECGGLMWVKKGEVSE